MIVRNIVRIKGFLIAWKVLNLLYLNKNYCKPIQYVGFDNLMVNLQR